MRKLVIGLGVITASLAGAVAVWRRNPRMGTHVMNQVVNPLLVQRGIAGAARAEIGTIEHFGRRTGTRHLTPVHPVPTDTGFRVVVPLAGASHWARNVIAAGHCRLQLHDVVYDLDEPVLLAPDEVGDLARPVQWLGSRLGVQYLLLHRFAERPGALAATVDEPEAEAAGTAVDVAREEAPASA